MDPIAEALITHGLTPAIMVALFLTLYLRKDKELKEERVARIGDAKDTLVLVMKVQEKTSENIGRLSDIQDALRNQALRNQAGGGE